MTAKQQVAEAIRELTKFREVRARDEKDDSEEMLNTAKIKEGEIAAASAPAAPPPPPPAHSGARARRRRAEPRLRRGRRTAALPCPRRPAKH